MHLILFRSKLIHVKRAGVLLLKKPFENKSCKQAVNVRRTLAGVYSNYSNSKAIAVVLQFMSGFCCVEHRVAFAGYLKQVDVRQEVQ